MRYLRTLGHVVFDPVDFFRLDRADHERRPLGFLTTSVALAAGFAVLQTWVLTRWGLPEAWFDSEQQHASFRAACQQVVGQPCTVIDLRALTGVSFVDEPIRDLFLATTYFVFSVLLWAFSAFRLPARLTTAYYAHAVGLAVLCDAVVGLGLGLAWAVAVPAAQDAGSLLEVLFAVETVLQSAIRAVLMVVGPLWLFPRVAPAGGLRVLLAMGLSAAAFSVLMWPLTALMFTTGVVILRPVW